jgi:hypothetical protein
MEKIRSKFNNKIFVAFCFYVLFCSSCKNSEDKLVSYIESHCNFNKSDTCCIDFGNVVNVDYDVMYIFGESTTNDEISGIVGLPYNNDNNILDSEYRIILIKNKKIVYEDNVNQDKVIFSEKSALSDEEKSGNPTVFCIRNFSSKFKVIQKKKNKSEGDGFFYILQEIPD